MHQNAYLAFSKLFKNCESAKIIATI